jgi:hypothetical protein
MQEFLLILVPKMCRLEDSDRGLAIECFSSNEFKVGDLVSIAKIDESLLQVQGTALNFSEIPYLAGTFNRRMQLTVSAKQLGRKNALIMNKVIEIEDIGPHPTVQRLIEAVVEQQVREYNSKPLEKNLLPFLDQNTIDTGAKSGKVGFGSIYNETKADSRAAQKTALQAFADGLFVLFADDREFTNPEETIIIQSTTIITFIRLTFLAGSYW